MKKKHTKFTMGISLLMALTGISTYLVLGYIMLMLEPLGFDLLLFVIAMILSFILFMQGVGWVMDGGFR